MICAGASQIALTALTANAPEWRKNMLNVGIIEEGFVLDHIKAGKSMSIYHHLQLDKLDCPVAIIKNARSNKMGKKDILKVECDINTLDLDVLPMHCQLKYPFLAPFSTVSLSISLHFLSLKAKLSLCLLL